MEISVEDLGARKENSTIYIYVYGMNNIVKRTIIIYISLDDA